jgi:hypothetical protein
MAPATLDVCAAQEKATARMTTPTSDDLTGRLLSNKNMPASNEQNGWINRANPCVECERIRFGEVGAGNSKYLQPKAVRKTRKD